MATVADTLVAQFERMVRRDGGELSLLGVEGDVIRVGYRTGSDPGCPELAGESGDGVLARSDDRRLALRTRPREFIGRGEYHRL